jgi:hypothetical protein
LSARTDSLYPCSQCGHFYGASPPDDVHTIIRIDPCEEGDSVKQQYECQNCGITNERYWDLVHFISIIDKQVSTIDPFLRSATKDVSIFGITLEDTLRGHSETVKAILNSKVKSFRILLFDPKSKFLKEVGKQVGTNVNTISSSIKSLQDLRNDSDISEKDLKKLQIRTFNGIPVQSIFIIDRNIFFDATARFEPYIYGITKQRRFLYEVSKMKYKQLFQALCASYDKMWKVGKQVRI